MPNTHTPERQPHETLEQYSARRRISRHSVNMGRNAETGELVFLKGLGDQHKAPSLRQQLRDNARKAGNGPKGTFGAGLVASWAKKRRESKAHLAKHPRDAHGAVTFVGPKYELDGVKPTPGEFEFAGGVHEDGMSFHTVRRIWRGGISAQRGY